MGKYKMISKESKGLLRGEYGRLPAPTNPEVVKKALGEDANIITHRPADDIAPEMDKYREEIKGVMEQEEDVLSYALFPQVASDYFKFRQAQKYKIDSTLSDDSAKVQPV